MTIGYKLLELRKKAGLSQEEAAERLGVSRQTISKWETDQSTPDFDKLSLICKLYNITADELINGTKKEEDEIKDDLKENNMEHNTGNNIENKKKRALGIGFGIFLYFLAIVEVMITIPLRILNPIVASAIFLAICGLATGIIVYVCLVYKESKKEKVEKENPIVKQINEVIAIIILVIYLAISFITMAWHITWILWIVYALIEEIVKLIFALKGVK